MKGNMEEGKKKETNAETDKTISESERSYKAVFHIEDHWETLCLRYQPL